MSPRTTVPTQSDLAPRPQPVQPVQVAVGGPSNMQNNGSSQVEVKAPEPASPGQTFVNNDQSTDVQNTTAVTDGAPVISKAPPVAQAPDSQTQSPPTGNSDIAMALRDAAKQHGEELVALGGGGNSTGTASGSGKSAPAGTKAYVAVEGDSLSKMAGRFLGSNTKANRDAIIAANPTLKQNPNIIVSGRTYNIPTSASSTGVASATPVAGAVGSGTCRPTPRCPGHPHHRQLVHGERRRQPLENRHRTMRQRRDNPGDQRLEQGHAQRRHRRYQHEAASAK